MLEFPINGPDGQKNTTKVGLGLDPFTEMILSFLQQPYWAGVEVWWKDEADWYHLNYSAEY